MSLNLEARARSEVYLIAPLVSDQMSPSRIQESLVQLFGLGMADDSENLLDISTEDGTPRVFRYNLQSIIVGAIAIVGGSFAGFWGAVVALAGLWELWGFRESLSPSACVIVWVLSEAGKAGIKVEDLESKFHILRAQLFANPEMPGEFVASLLDLERQEIIAREPSHVLLKEVHFVSPVLWST